MSLAARLPEFLYNRPFFFRKRRPVRVSSVAEFDKIFGRREHVEVITDVRTFVGLMPGKYKVEGEAADYLIRQQIAHTGVIGFKNADLGWDPRWLQLQRIRKAYQGISSEALRLEWDWPFRWVEWTREDGSRYMRKVERAWRHAR